MCKTCTTFSARPSLQNDMDGGVAAALIEEEAEQRACPDLDAHWRLDEAMDRAEKAEEVADARRAEIVRLSQDRNDWEGNALDAEDRAEKAEQERDKWKILARQAENDLNAAQRRDSRPFTPDDITDDARQRAYRAVAALSVSDWDDLSGVAKGRAMAVVEAVITEVTRPEPPARPEGAAEIEAALKEEWTFEDDEEFTDLADRLARRLHATEAGR